jgi:hypothetical protein
MKEKIHDRMSRDLTLGSEVAIAIVTDPYSQSGEHIQVLRSIRDDPLAGMLSRRQINEAQFQAGRRWQSLHEKSTIGAMGAIDPGKEAVDGGRMREFLTDYQVRAFRELADSFAVLGPELGRLIFDILATRMTIAQAALSRGLTRQRQILKVGISFRGGLETLAIHYGFAMPKRAA